MVEPLGLGERGSAIWQARSKGLVDPAALGLVTELARTADRLDELDNIIQGKGVLNLMRFRMPHGDWDSSEITVEVKFDSVLSEARQQQQRFTELYRTVEALSPAAKPAVGASAPAKLPANVTPLQKVLSKRGG